MCPNQDFQEWAVGHRKRACGPAGGAEPGSGAPEPVPQLPDLFPFTCPPASLRALPRGQPRLCWGRRCGSRGLTSGGCVCLAMGWRRLDPPPGASSTVAPGPHLILSCAAVGSEDFPAAGSRSSVPLLPSAQTCTPPAPGPALDMHVFLKISFTVLSVWFVKEQK